MESTLLRAILLITPRRRKTFDAFPGNASLDGERRSTQPGQIWTEDNGHCGLNLLHSPSGTIAISLTATTNPAKETRAPSMSR